MEHLPNIACQGPPKTASVRGVVRVHKFAWTTAPNGVLAIAAASALAALAALGLLTLVGKRQQAAVVRPMAAHPRVTGKADRVCLSAVRIRPAWLRLRLAAQLHPAARFRRPLADLQQEALARRPLADLQREALPQRPLADLQREALPQRRAADLQQEGLAAPPLVAVAPVEPRPAPIHC